MSKIKGLHHRHYNCVLGESSFKTIRVRRFGSSHHSAETPCDSLNHCIVPVLLTPPCDHISSLPPYCNNAFPLLDPRDNKSWLASSAYHSPSWSICTRGPRTIRQNYPHSPDRSAEPRCHEPHVGHYSHTRWRRKVRRDNLFCRGARFLWGGGCVRALWPPWTRKYIDLDRGVGDHERHESPMDRDYRR